MIYTKQQIEGYLDRSEPGFKDKNELYVMVKESAEIIRQLQAQLATAKTHIGWLKEDKARLSKSIKVRDQAMCALIDINEKEEKHLKTELATANADISLLREQNVALQQELSDEKDENKRLREAMEQAETDLMMMCPGLNRNNALKHIKQALKEKPCTEQK